MTALETLRHLRQATAAQVAEQSGLALEIVYLDLVAAEASGLVAVRCHSAHGRTTRRWWVML